MKIVFICVVLGSVIIGGLLKLLIDWHEWQQLKKRTDEMSRIKRESKKPHLRQDHNKRFRKKNRNSIILWSMDGNDVVLNLLETMRIPDIKCRGIGYESAELYANFTK